MPFFIQKILDAYQTRLEIADVFLYSKETILSQYKTSGRVTRSSVENSIQNTCGTQIGTEYISKVTRRLFSDPHMDLMICTKVPLESIPIENLEAHVSGFVISEKGECKEKPDAHCLNLICANKVGNYLIGAYLYSIIENAEVTDKLGILELANGYLNPVGLCLYEKYGFSYNASLFGDICFSDPHNLPMAVSMSAYGSTKSKQCARLLDIVLKRGTFAFPKHFICDIADKPFQKMVGAMLNVARLKTIRPKELTKVEVLDEHVDYALIHSQIDVDVILDRIQKGMPIHKDSVMSYYKDVFTSNVTPSPTNQKKRIRSKSAPAAAISAQSTKKKTKKRKRKPTPTEKHKPTVRRTRSQLNMQTKKNRRRAVL